MAITFVPLQNVNASASVPQVPREQQPSAPSCGVCNCAEGNCSPAEQPVMNPIPEIIEVLFKGRRRAVFRNELKLAIPLAAFIVVEAKQGYDAGVVIAVDDYAEKHLQDKQLLRAPLYPVLRLATKEDMAHHAANRSEEHDIVMYARTVAKEYGHDIKITDAEWQLDRKQLTIFFTSPTRIDFRELAKAYARKYKTRIELRQISQRGEAKRLGGFGTCGKQLCCVSLKEMNEHISVDHHRLQSLIHNNTSRLTGVCGRLKCCLLYEAANTPNSAAP